VGTYVDTSRAIVQLSLAPLSTNPRTKPAPGKKIDYSSTTTKSERARLSAQRNQFKKWLQSVAPKAKVTSEFDISVNAVSVALNGTALSTLKGGPGVVSVSYEGTYRPLDADDPDLGIINAIEAWGAEGGANAGAGVKVGVVDSGIDQDHPCFDGLGADGLEIEYPDFSGNAGDPRFTNSKVVIAKVFNMRAKVKGYTPEAVDSHGTHVAGTIACELDTPAAIGTTKIPYGVSGVAPAAQLGNYNVFPADVANARSEDILNALDAAAADGMDVLNMSLGGGAHGIQDLLTVAVDNLDRMGIVVAVSNGNEGPGHYTVGSPGSAERALSAGASTVGHFVGLPLTVEESVFAAATGDFASPAVPLIAPLAVVTGTTNGLSTACTVGDLPLPSLSGAIALISRGNCSFSEKIRNAQNAGAVAVVVANNVAGDPTAMASDGTADQPTVPAVMVGLMDGLALQLLAGEQATLGSTPDYQRTANDNIMAGFSSQGPTDVDFRVKPDVVAPGVNVLSSIPGGGWAFYSGTSMAAPHLAGMAAVVKGADRILTAEQVRSVIVNTATEGELTDYRNGTAIVTDVNVVGAGLANLQAAVDAPLSVGPVSTSFGAVPSGSGKSLTKLVRVTNLSSGALELDLGIAGETVFSVDSGSLSLGAGDSAEVRVTLDLPKRAALGDHSGSLTISSGGTELAHSVLYVFVK
jgi:subtilisin family serine protease